MKIAVVALFVTLAPGLASAATGYTVHNLVSDVPGTADFTDPNLVNAWGNATSAASPFWVCDAGTGLSTVYAASNTPGAPLGTPNANLKPTIPAAGGSTGGSCTGIVANTATGNFLISTTAKPTPTQASFIFATEEGTISGWANGVDPAHAVLVVDNSKTANYKGLAIVTTPTPQLYAANFKAGTIDVFDKDFKPVTLAAGAFTDVTVPSGYAPFNIWNLGGKLYVTYAKQDANKEDDVAGAGNGFVAVFDASGNLIKHLISGGALNSPWGVAIAPAAFGKFANDLLVGNFGDGKINAYDPATGALLGTLQDAQGKDIVINGLWSLLVGNGGNGGDTSAVYFTAGPGGEKHGLLGSIQANPVVTAANIFNAAQGAGGIAPNTYITIKGNNLASTKRTWAAKDFSGNKLNTSLDNVTVTLNGTPAYLSYISPVQINLLTPSDLATSGPVQVVVTNNGLTSDTITVQAQPVAPSFFLINSDKYIAATHSDNVSLVGPTTLIANATTPAKPGEIIVLYGNGFGPTSPQFASGQIITSPLDLAVKPNVLFNNVPGEVIFAGLSGTGLYQINVRVPTGLPDGDVPVVAQFGASSTPTGALITIKN